MGRKPQPANPQTIMTKLTKEILNAAGFKPIDRDKFTIKWVLITPFCDVTIYESTWRHATKYTLAGITHPDDRVVVTGLEMLYKALELLGADTVAMERIEKAIPKE